MAYQANYSNLAALTAAAAPSFLSPAKVQIEKPDRQGQVTGTLSTGGTPWAAHCRCSGPSSHMRFRRSAGCEAAQVVPVVVVPAAMWCQLISGEDLPEGTYYYALTAPQ